MMQSLTLAEDRLSELRWPGRCWSAGTALPRAVGRGTVRLERLAP